MIRRLSTREAGFLATLDALLHFFKFLLGREEVLVPF